MITTSDLSKYHLGHEVFTDKAYDNPSLLPDRYVFIITNMCNLRCPFCFQKKEPRSDAMTTEDWLTFAAQLPDYARVTLTGGEPLIFPGFRKIFSFVATRFPCNIITNGIALNESVIDYILSFPNFKVLSLSIDTIGNIDRKVRPNQWAHVEKMIQYFITRRNKMESDALLDIKTIVLDENMGDLLNIHTYFLEKLKTDTHVFQLLKGSPIQHADYMFTFRDIVKKSHAPVYKKFDLFLKQLEKVRQYDLKHGRTTFIHPKICEISTHRPIPDIGYINNPYHVKEKFQPCKFPWSSMHINFEGTVFPCLAVSMGNVKREKLKDIWNEQNYTRFRDLIRKEGTIEACNRCGWIRPVH